MIPNADRSSDLPVRNSLSWFRVILVFLVWLLGTPAIGVVEAELSGGGHASIVFVVLGIYVGLIGSIVQLVAIMRPDFRRRDLLARVLVLGSSATGVSGILVLAVDRLVMRKDMVANFHGEWGMLPLIAFSCFTISWLASLIDVRPRSAAGSGRWESRL
jgi:hypothetical protein